MNTEIKKKALAGLKVYSESRKATRNPYIDRYDLQAFVGDEFINCLNSLYYADNRDTDFTTFVSYMPSSINLPYVAVDKFINNIDKVDINIANPHVFISKYKNWEGVVSLRTLIPMKELHSSQIYYGASPYHPERQWMISGFDLDKMALRTYALKDFMGFSADSGTTTF